MSAANLWGDNEALTFEPVNIWAGTFLLAAALDLGRQHTALADRRARWRALTR